MKTEYIIGFLVGSLFGWFIIEYVSLWFAKRRYKRGARKKTKEIFPHREKDSVVKMDIECMDLFIQGCMSRNQNKKVQDEHHHKACQANADYCMEVEYKEKKIRLRRFVIEVDGNRVCPVTSDEYNQLSRIYSKE